jgi:hypothetical protein
MVRPCADFERSIAKYYFGEKSNFSYLLKNLFLIKENLSQTQRLFNFKAVSVLKKVNLNV